MRSEIIERLRAWLAQVEAERDEARARAAAAYEAAAQTCRLFRDTWQADGRNEMAEAAHRLSEHVDALATEAERDALTAALAKARAEERERCAKVARQWGAQFEPFGHPAMGDDEIKLFTSCQIAAAIRALGKGDE